MAANLDSSAPHIHEASTWRDGLMESGDRPDPNGGRSRKGQCLLWKGDGDGFPEVGIREQACGRRRLDLLRDEFCHVTSGCAIYRSDDGEVIEAGAGTVVHFRGGWSGEIEVTQTLRVLYMIR